MSYPQPTPARRLLRDLPTEEQPRYRLQHAGVNALATSELLALVLGSADAPGLACDLLTAFGSLHKLARAPRGRLTRTHGIGRAQAARLLAVFELGRRLQLPPADERPQIATPADAAALLLPTMRQLDQEELRVLLLDARNRVLETVTIYRGSLTTSVLRLAELFRPAIEAPAAAIIIAHNHPSGDPTPSPEDVRVTREIVRAGQLLGIDVLDHVIIGAGRFFSLKERGLGFD